MPLGLLTPPDLATANLIEGMILTSQEVLTTPNNSGKVTRTLTVTPSISLQEITTYRLRDNTSGITVSFVTDATPTQTEIVTGLANAIRANSILNGMLIVSGTTTLILTSRVLGSKSYDFDFVDGGTTPTNVLVVGTATEGSDAVPLLFGRGLTYSQATSNASLIAAALSSSNFFAGITGFTQADLDYVINGSPAYNADAAVNNLRKGRIVVYSATAVNPTSQVWLNFSGVNRGRFRATDSTLTDNSQITSGAAWLSRTTSAGLAILSLNLP